MRKLIALLLGSLLVLASCASDTDYMPLEALDEAYTLSDAKTDGCVVFEDSKITVGQEQWDAFVTAAEFGASASVRIVNYYTLGDPSRYAPEMYESIKYEYPKMFIQDLAYNGENYTLRWFEDEEIVRTYKYLMKYEGEPSSQFATYDHYVRYVLVNDNTVAWEDIEHGLLSAVFDDYIEHNTVYVDLQ